MQKYYYRPDELAKAIDVSVRCIYRHIKAGRIQYVCVGHLIRIPSHEYERIIKRGVTTVH